MSDEVASSPFAGELLKGAQQLAWETGNVILSVDTFNEPDLEAAAIDMMLSYRVKGVVYASMYHRVLDLPAGLEAVPTVVVDAQERSKRVASVFPDEEAGGYAATRQLIEAGHTRIAMINIQPEEDSDLPAGIGRLAGYRRALSEAGIVDHPELVRYGGGIVEDGLALTLDLFDLDEPPTAIFSETTRAAAARRARVARAACSGGLLHRRFRQPRDARPDSRPGALHHRAPLRADGACGNRTAAVRQCAGAHIRSGSECVPILRGSVADVEGACLTTQAPAESHPTVPAQKSRVRSHVRRALRSWQLYVLLTPAVIYIIVFKYWPMYGAQIAFRDYDPALGFAGSPWVGLEHFIRFVNSFQFWRLIENTLTVNALGLLIAFPVPIILALVVNQLCSPRFKKFTQTVLRPLVHLGGHHHRHDLPAVLTALRHHQQRHRRVRRRTDCLHGVARLVPAAVHRIRYLAERPDLDDRVPRSADGHRPRPA